MSITVDEVSCFLADGGLPECGSVLVYHDSTTGVPYELKSIAWRLIEETGVGIAAYNTPKNLNALSPNQIMEHYLVLEHAKRDPNVKAVVWTGTGPRSFNSGAALKGDLVTHVPRDIIVAYSKLGMAPTIGDWVQAPLTKAFWDFPKPLIMAVNGLAVGGGCNIALANCGDIVLCSTKARFTYPFAKLGVTPEFGSSLMMPFLVGMSKAKELMMLAEWLSASDALRFNLVSAVYEPEELLPKAIEMATKAAKFHPEGMRLIKQVMNAPLRKQLDEVLVREQDIILKSIESTGGFAKNSKL